MNKTKDLLVIGSAPRKNLLCEGSRVAALFGNLYMRLEWSMMANLSIINILPKRVADTYSKGQWVLHLSKKLYLLIRYQTLMMANLSIIRDTSILQTLLEGFFVEEIANLDAAFNCCLALVNTWAYYFQWTTFLQLKRTGVHWICCRDGLTCSMFVLLLREVKPSWRNWALRQKLWLLPTVCHRFVIIKQIC